jgi:hypothetical protein
LESGYGDVHWPIKPKSRFINFLIPIIHEYDSLFHDGTLHTRAPEIRKSDNNSSIMTSERKQGLSEESINAILDKFGVDLEAHNHASLVRPLKDLRRDWCLQNCQERSAQSAIVVDSVHGKDDPRVDFMKTARHAAEDSDIHLLTDLKCVADIEVNVSKSFWCYIRNPQGRIGLSVAEALWNMLL